MGRYAICPQCGARLEVNDALDHFCSVETTPTDPRGYSRRYQQVPGSAPADYLERCIRDMLDRQGVWTDSDAIRYMAESAARGETWQRVKVQNSRGEWVFSEWEIPMSLPAETTPIYDDDEPTETRTGCALIAALLLLPVLALMFGMVV